MVSIDELDMMLRTDGEVPEAHWPSPVAYVRPDPSEAPHGLPWPTPWSAAKNINVSIEARVLRSGAISRLRSTRMSAAELAGETARARADSIYVLHVLSGAITLAQEGCERNVATGGVIVFDATRAARLQLSARSGQDIVALTVPRHRLARHGLSRNWKDGALIADRASARLLTGSLALLAEQLQAPAEDELDVLFEACLSLLALAPHQRAGAAGHAEGAPETATLQAVLAYVDAHLADAALTPARAARRFSVSTRYLHKLFEGSGTTFCAYVVNRRLEQIHGELACGSAAPQPIAALAQRWGFGDLSSFNRAFKKRFGVAPRRARASARG